MEREEEIIHVVRLLECTGLPSCCGLVDCVHLVWYKCPSRYLSYRKEKEKHATLYFQAVMSHRKKTLVLSKFFDGATKDKSIWHCDLDLQKFRTNNEEMSGLEWGTFKKDRVERKQKGGC